MRHKVDHNQPLSQRPDQRLFDQVCDRLRSAIVTGHYAPGTRMVERELTSRLKVSRTPIREAFRRLEEEGLVVGYPHRGYFVREPTFDEAKQAYEMRRIVETAACGLAAERATEVDIAAMREAIRMAQAVIDSGDRMALLLCNKEIHLLMVRSAGNAFIEKEWHSMWAFADLMRGRWWSKTDRPETGHYEHKALVEAIAEHDTKLVRRLASEHVDKAWANIVKRFK
jgi:DNA-binding GntR family transcriptional regulator